MDNDKVMVRDDMGKPWSGEALEICHLTPDQIVKADHRVQDVLACTGYGEVGFRIRNGRIASIFVLIEDIESKM